MTQVRNPKYKSTSQIRNFKCESPHALQFLITSTQIGTGVASTDLILDLNVNCAGEMFGVNTVTDRLVRINITTGAVTTVNPANSIGIDVNDVVSTNGMDFDNITGTLYAFLHSNAKSLYGTVNTITSLTAGASLSNSGGMIASPSACSTDGLFEDGFEEN